MGNRAAEVNYSEVWFTEVNLVERLFQVIYSIFFTWTHFSRGSIQIWVTKGFVLQRSKLSSSTVLTTVISKSARAYEQY